MSPNKQTITQAVLAAIEQNGPKDFDEALIGWWSNIRAAGGLRLTVHGYHAFQAAELESWAVEMEDIKITMNKRLLLELDRKLKYPYFIDYKNKKDSRKIAGSFSLKTKKSSSTQARKP